MRGMESIEVLRPTHEFRAELAPDGELCLKSILTLAADKEAMEDSATARHVVAGLDKAAGRGPKPGTAVFTCQVPGCEVSVQADPSNLMASLSPDKPEFDACIVES